MLLFRATVPMKTTLLADTPIGLLLWTVFEAILEVFLLCFAGYVLARKNIIDKKTQKQLNRINVSLFTPCLLFSKVAFNLTPSKLKELWIIPVFFVLVTTVSTLVAFFLGWAFRLRRTQRNFAIAASMFMNSNSLPIALMQSLVITVDGLKWGAQDDADSMLGRALSYLVVYSTMGMILRWSYGVHLLSQADDPKQDRADAEAQGAIRLPDEERLLEDSIDNGPVYNHHDLHADAQDPSALAHSPHSGSAQTLQSNPSVVFTDVDADRDQGLENGNGPLISPRTVDALGKAVGKGKGKHLQVSVVNEGENGKGRKRHRVRHYFYSFPNTPASSRSQLQGSRSPSSAAGSSASPTTSTYTSEDDLHGDPDTSQPHPTPRTSHKSNHNHNRKSKSSLRRLIPRLRTVTRAVLEFMTAPLWAALISLIVALTPPLQHVLAEHADPVRGALTASGNCSIPVTLVVLGAYFYTPAPKTGEDGGAGAENGMANGVVDGAPPNRTGRPMGREDTERAGRRAASSVSFVGSIRDMLRLRTRRRGSHSDHSGQEQEVRERRARTRTLPGETTTVCIAVFARMIITPALILPLMVLFTRFDLQEVFADPVFVVANVLLISAPPALTLAQITQAASGDAFERLLSRTIFWSYCVLTPPATIVYVVLGMLLVKL